MKLDLTVKIPGIINKRQGEVQEQVQTELPISGAVIQSLERSSRNFTEAKRNAAILGRVRTNAPFEVTDAEFAIICNSIQYLESTSKAIFAEMVENLNEDFSFEKLEQNG